MNGSGSGSATTLNIGSSGFTFYLNNNITADAAYTQTQIGGFTATGFTAFLQSSIGTQTVCSDGAGGALRNWGACNASLRKLKENIIDSSYGINTIMKLKPVEFDYKPEYGGEHHIGFIADDTPLELVVYDQEGNIRDLANDRDFISVLVKAVQELKAEIDELRKWRDNQSGRTEHEGK
jgi:hypothetical protein